MNTISRFPSAGTMLQDSSAHHPTLASSQANTCLQSSPPSVVSFYCPSGERLVTLPGFSLSHLQSTWKASTNLVSPVSQPHLNILSHCRGQKDNHILISPVSQPHPNILSDCRGQKDNHVLRNACSVHMHQMLYLPDTQRHMRGTKQERERLFIAVGWLQLTCYSVSGTISCPRESVKDWACFYDNIVL